MNKVFILSSFLRDVTAKHVNWSVKHVKWCAKKGTNQWRCLTSLKSHLVCNGQKNTINISVAFLPALIKSVMRPISWYRTVILITQYLRLSFYIHSAFDVPFIWDVVYFSHGGVILVALIPARLRQSNSRYTSNSTPCFMLFTVQ